MVHAGELNSAIGVKIALRVQPEMTAIRERYADDKMKQQQARRVG